MRTDALDRFGTRLEQRFTRQEVADMLRGAGLRTFGSESSRLSGAPSVSKATLTALKLPSLIPSPVPGPHLFDPLAATHRLRFRRFLSSAWRGAFVDGIFSKMNSSHPGVMCTPSDLTT